MKPSIAVERPAPTRGVIVLIHGLGEHSGRYGHVVDRLLRDGWSVATYDQQGHGRTPGARGTLSGPAALYEDLAVVIDSARGSSDTPLLLFGHSMGGAIAARFVAEALSPRPAAWSRPVNGLILTSPALATFIARKDRVAIGILRWLAPNLPRRNGLDATKISHDPAVVADYLADPLVHDRVTPRLVHAILEAGATVLARAALWCTPTLLLYAGDDFLVDRRGSSDFASKAPPDVVETHAFAGLYHEILNETEPARSDVLAVVLAWLARRH